MIARALEAYPAAQSQQPDQKISELGNKVGTPQPVRAFLSIDVACFRMSGNESTPPVSNQ